MEQTHRAPEVVPPRADVGERSADTEGSPGNAATVSEVGAGGSGVPRGGGTWEVKRGDTLWSIARRVYGDPHKWRDIMRANPERVFRGGDLILVGDELVLPSLTVPEPEAQAPESTPDGGNEQSVEPIEVCTEYGNFRIYPDDYIGPLPLGENDVEVVRASEYERLIRERDEAANEQRVQTQSRVDSLLSYGVFDWAITDAEATEAFNLLVALPMRQLQTAVGRIPTIGRLLENLPPRTRNHPLFPKLLVALGPARIAPYLQELLSTGLFNWAVTPQDIQAVLDIVSMTTGGQRDALLVQLGRDRQHQVLQAIPGRGTALPEGHKQVVRSIFFSAADGDMELIELAFAIRFNQTVRGQGDVAWDAPTLRRSWEVLEQLPPGHVEGNPEQLQWIRYGTRGAGGGWYDGRETVRGEENPDYRGSGFTVDADRLDGLNQAADEGDPLRDVVRFNKVVRHEIGHAVDNRINASATYCIGNAAGGDWREYGRDTATVVDEMVAASGGAISGLEGDLRTAVVGVIKRAARGGDTSTLAADIAALEGVAALEEGPRATLLADPVIEALTTALDQPWYRHLPDGGTPLGGRIFQRSYPSKWSSYAVEARARKVSQYQWRAPGEWFAEVYATYYEPNPGTEVADGSLLAGVDAPTKAWMDRNVAPLGSLR